MKATEHEYLLWFFQEADFGPASENVRQIMNERFVEETGKELPDGFGSDE